jgi:hypothetical protein
MEQLDPTFTGCVHHYVFPAPNGPLSIGVCKRCGDEMAGANSSDKTVRSDGTLVDTKQHARAVARANSVRAAHRAHRT